MSQEIQLIKDYLNSLGHDYRGQPLFRLSFADDCFELREGIYNEFKGDLFTRTIHGVKKTHKYPNCLGCWIIEKLILNLDRVQDKSLIKPDGYELLYAFKNMRGFKPLPPLLRVTRIVIASNLAYVNSSRMLRKSNDFAQEEAKEKRMDDYTFDAIDPSSPIESALHFREGISLAGLEIPNDAKEHEKLSSVTSKSGK